MPAAIFDTVSVLAHQTPAGVLMVGNHPTSTPVAARVVREQDFRKIIAVVNAARRYVKDCELSVPIDLDAKRLLNSVARLDQPSGRRKKIRKP